ncbi:MAG: Hsp70 family protein, partial [Deltaproteobacteria bacterium]|nr:Hsp70 family protein [Deltaproteobacteria bacterium]
CEQALKDVGMTASNINEVVMVGGMIRVPKIHQFVKDFFGREPHKGVNPDEVVAVGAAIQAGVLAGEVKEVVLLDVTPLSLGVETLGGVMTKMVNRNTTIPTTKKEVYTTAADNQTQVEIHVLQGEREMARDNRTLGRFHLIGIPSAPRGMPQIEVRFDIDANGILNVSAKDLATNKEQKITITASSGLAKDEVEKMVKDAESHAEEDRKRKEVIELKNQLDSVIYATEKTLNEHKAKLPASDVKAIEDAAAEGKKALEKENVDDMKKALDNINKASHKMAEVMYQAASQAGAAGEQPGAGAKKEGDVVEAEFVDEENKREDRK